MANPTLRTIRLVLWGLVAIAIVTVGIYVLLPRGATSPSPIAPAVAQQYGAGDYTLVTDEGEPADDSIFVGQPSMVFFGFTHCPDVCPTTLGEMALWFSELGEEAADLRAFFVTVDPERDTPEVLNQYVGWVSDRITGLTGTPENIDAMAAAWGVHHEVVPLDTGGYNVDHTASVFLIDAQGEFQGTIAYGEATQTALDKLRMLVRG